MIKISKNKQKVMEEWIKDNGACSFDYNKHDIVLHDGGLFCIEKKKVRLHKIVGYKKLPNGYRQVLFSKNKPIKSEEYKAILWMEDLDETINYFKRMKKMLNKLGIRTDISKIQHKKLIKK